MAISVRSKIVLRFGAATLGLVMVAVLVRALRRDGPAALDAWRAAHVQWAWVLFTVACALTGQAVYVVGWRRLLRDSNVHPPFWTLVRVFLVSNLGRYLPAGKAWQMAIVAAMAAEQHLPSAVLAATSLFQGIVGVGVGAIVVFAAGGATIGLSPLWLFVAVAAAASFVVAPRIIRSFPRFHAIILRRIPSIDSVDAATMWALIWTSTASWILWGIALFGLAKALLPAAQASIAAFVAAWTGSFLAGLIALVSPAGLGARESVMQGVLTRAGMRPADVLVLVVVARAWVTLLDIVPAVIVLVLRRRSQRDTSASSLVRGPAQSSSSVDHAG
jgi:hypothetical protein